MATSSFSLHHLHHQTHRHFPFLRLPKTQNSIFLSKSLPKSKITKWVLKSSLVEQQQSQRLNGLVDFLYEDLPHLFDDQGIDATMYDDRVLFRDPITKHDTIGGYLFNIRLLKGLFRPGFLLHSVRQLWSWSRLSAGSLTLLQAVSVDDDKPLGCRYNVYMSWDTSLYWYIRFYRNEFNLLDAAHTQWCPYTDDVLQALPEICIAGAPIWCAQTPMICYNIVHMHVPDRVLRQFGLVQHVPGVVEYIPRYRLGDELGIGAGDIPYIQRWNERAAHVFEETGPYEITTRWTMVMTFVLLPWKPQLVFTGVSIMGVNPKTQKFCSHVDLWDSIENNDYFSFEGFLDVLKQLQYYKTPKLESPKYQILKRTATYEVRKYEPFVIAETKGEKLSGSSGFNDVAGYIFGRNSTNEKIPMTTPVFTQAVDDELSEVSIQIVLPMNKELENLPSPAMEAVKLREVEGVIAAALKFSGKPTEEVVVNKEKELRSALLKAGLKPREGCMLARYNDPGRTWSFIMRNEVLIWLDDFSLE